MIGVRFGAVCTVLIAGMLASSAGQAAPACDKRFSRTCRATTAQVTREAPTVSTTQRTATATRTRTRRATRQRHSFKHAQSAKPTRQEAEQPKPAARTPENPPAPARVVAAPENPPAPARVVAAPEVSPAARRFSEFVSPRPLAANPVEELHKPRMNVTELSAQTTYPVAEAIEREPSAAARPAEATMLRTMAVEAQQATEPTTANGLQKPSGARTESSGQPAVANLVSRPEDHDAPESTTSWVRIVFLTWGGLLTVGSALRLLIG
jgi:hypothetical protein